MLLENQHLYVFFLLFFCSVGLLSEYSRCYKQHCKKYLGKFMVKKLASVVYRNFLGCHFHAYFFYNDVFINILMLINPL